MINFIEAMLFETHSSDNNKAQVGEKESEEKDSASEMMHVNSDREISGSEIYQTKLQQVSFNYIRFLFLNKEQIL